MKCSVEKQKIIKRKISYLKELYDLAFDDIPEGIINLGEFNTEFSVGDDVRDSLLELLKSVYEYTKKCERFAQLYPSLKSDSEFLRSKLAIVYRYISHTLRTDLDVVSIHLDDETKKWEFVVCD